MQIGTFTLAKDGGWTGSIRTLTINAKVRLAPNDDRTSDAAPAFRGFVGTSRIGDAWEAHTSGDMPRTYWRLKFDDPSLPEPLPIALFQADHGGYMVAWRRENMRSDFGGGMGTSRTNYDDRGSRDEGGFGDSTAGADGELAGAGAPFGEEDPF